MTVTDESEKGHKKHEEGYINENATAEMHA